MRRSTFPFLAALFALGLFACERDIGDECGSDYECGRGRSCDRVSKGGYCTITPCDLDSCPEEALCVEFEDSTTACMRTCKKSDDCRDGYFCDTESAALGFCRQKP